MSTLSRISAIAGATALLVSWTGMDANAQQTSLCFERCTSQYGWPQLQCARYCRQRDNSQARVYGYTRRTGADASKAGSCGTYKFWNGDVCFDARDK